VANPWRTKGLGGLASSKALFSMVAGARNHLQADSSLTFRFEVTA